MYINKCMRILLLPVKFWQLFLQSWLSKFFIKSILKHVENIHILVHVFYIYICIHILVTFFLLSQQLTIHCSKLFLALSNFSAVLTATCSLSILSRSTALRYKWDIKTYIAHKHCTSKISNKSFNLSFPKVLVNTVNNWCFDSHNRCFSSCNNCYECKSSTVYCYLLTFTSTTDPVPSSSNTSPPSVSLSGFRQISIMLNMDRFPQSLSLRALLNNFRAAVGLPVYLKEGPYKASITAQLL